MEWVSHVMIIMAAMQTDLLLIDDDEALTAILSEYLSREAFHITVRHDAQSGLAALREKLFDLVILDVMLPDQSGFDVLETLRLSSNLPVIMLTARGDDLDRIAGLENGADDYVSKPCMPRELLARIKAILRRVQQPEALPEITNGPLRLKPAQRQALWEERPLRLTSLEFNLLHVLASRAGMLISKQDLSLHGLGRPWVRYDRSIDVHVSSLRHKLGQREDGTPWLQNVRGQGYLMIKD